MNKPRKPHQFPSKSNLNKELYVSSFPLDQSANVSFGDGTQTRKRSRAKSASQDDSSSSKDGSAMNEEGKENAEESGDGTGKRKLPMRKNIRKVRDESSMSEDTKQAMRNERERQQKLKVRFPPNTNTNWD